MCNILFIIVWYFINKEKIEIEKINKEKNCTQFWPTVIVTKKDIFISLIKFFKGFLTIVEPP